MEFSVNFKTEKRASIEDPNVPISAANVSEALGWNFGIAASGVAVTIESALGVPAYWAGVNFLAGTLASLPLHAYRRTNKGPERIKGGLQTILHDAVNDGCSSFDWRKHCFEQTFTGGRGFSFIERNARDAVSNIWSLDPTKMTVKITGGKKEYLYKEHSREITYAASEIIDIPYMLMADMVSHRSPVNTCKDAIGLAIASTNYGSKIFENGGVPPFVLEGPFHSPGAMERAAKDMADAVTKAAKEKRQALSVPSGHSLKPIGADPEKMQLVELQKFLITQIARILSLPPVFLQDLTHGTFSNTEQQDLHLVKHTLKRWVVQFEQELNLKLFGRRRTNQYVEMNLDGLLRGDFKTQMEGLSKGVQNALMTPNEGRARLNLPDDPDGGKLMVQGATVPVSSQLALPL